MDDKTHKLIRELVIGFAAVLALVIVGAALYVHEAVREESAKANEAVIAQLRSEIDKTKAETARQVAGIEARAAEVKTPQERVVYLKDQARLPDPITFSIPDNCKLDGAKVVCVDKVTGKTETLPDAPSVTLTPGNQLALQNRLTSCAISEAKLDGCIKLEATQEQTVNEQKKEISKLKGGNKFMRIVRRVRDIGIGVGIAYGACKVSHKC